MSVTDASVGSDRLRQDPGVLRVRVRADQSETIGFFTRRGFGKDVGPIKDILDRLDRDWDVLPGDMAESKAEPDVDGCEEEI